MQLIHLAMDPGDLTREIHLIAQQLPRPRICAERIKRGGDYRGGLFLVVEDGEHGGAHCEDEEGDCAEPVPGGGERGEGAVGAAGHEGPRVWFWGGDEGAAGGGGGVGLEEAV